MRDVYIGFDNGATGSIGIINTKTNLVSFQGVPVVTAQDYTQVKKNITRIDRKEVLSVLKKAIPKGSSTFCILERPMINPSRFNASIIAARAFESVLTVLEELEIPYEVKDSRNWQKELLPVGTKGEADLKQASFDVGLRLFPSLRGHIIKQNEADGILIAEWARRKNY
jgi:hypothetical protein